MHLQHTTNPTTTKSTISPDLLLYLTLSPLPHSLLLLQPPRPFTNVKDAHLVIYLESPIVTSLSCACVWDHFTDLCCIIHTRAFGVAFGDRNIDTIHGYNVNEIRVTRDNNGGSATIDAVQGFSLISTLCMVIQSKERGS